MSISRCLPFRHDTGVVEQATVYAYALVWSRYALTRTDGGPCLVQLTVLDKDISFIISYEYRLVALCFGRQYWMCCSYSSILFPSCCLRIAAHRVCFVQIEVTVIRILYRAIILSDNHQPTKPTTLTRGGVLVVNDDSCRTNKGPLQTRCHTLQKMCGYFWFCLFSVFRLPLQNTARGDFWLRHICPSSPLFAWKYTNIWRPC
jgi:hypothetical protein